MFLGFCSTVEYIQIFHSWSSTGHRVNAIGVTKLQLVKARSWCLYSECFDFYAHRSFVIDRMCLVFETWPDVLILGYAWLSNHWAYWSRRSPWKATKMPTWSLRNNEVLLGSGVSSVNCNNNVKLKWRKWSCSYHISAHITCTCVLHIYAYVALDTMQWFFMSFKTVNCRDLYIQLFCLFFVCKISLSFSKWGVVWFCI